MGFDELWSALDPVGRDPRTGGYRRYAWTDQDQELREWFAAECGARGLDLTVDRAGNQWAWWGDPDQAARAGRPGVVTGSHLDSVPDGGAYDGPLGVVSGLLAIDTLRAKRFEPTRPIGVACFSDEEGARFGVACVGSRLVTGALEPDRARALADDDGTSLADAMARAGQRPDAVGRDDEALARVGCFVELHVEQGRDLVDRDRSVGVASAILPHGRWRLDLVGEANHAGTTRLADRKDPMLALAAVVATARREAEQRGCLATVGKVVVDPNGVNAIPSRVTAWLDARGEDVDQVRALVEHVGRAAGVRATEESFTSATRFDPSLAERLAQHLQDAPILATGAGHDAGILAAAGIPSAMLFVRNPSGVSHSPSEHAERTDCLAGIDALAAVVEDLAR
ncbi:MAG TPA: allantoate amidohydrolase [Mycobacteriales bacterium]|nr:allantoate amidohydrolase [Mycobacteriales bacterium]